jgi:hypothetical protein
MKADITLFIDWENQNIHFDTVCSALEALGIDLIKLIKHKYNLWNLSFNDEIRNTKAFEKLEPCFKNLVLKLPNKSNSKVPVFSYIEITE